jgi:hypothetical protein
MLGRNGLTCSLDVVKAFHGNPGESAGKVKERAADNAQHAPETLFGKLCANGLPSAVAMLIANKIEGLEFRIEALETERARRGEAAALRGPRGR